MTPGSSFERARDFFFSYGFYILLLLAVLYEPWPEYAGIGTV